MRWILAVLFVVFVQANRDAIQLMKNTLDRCIEKNGFDRGQIMHVWRELIAPEDNPDFEKLFGCVFEELHIIKDNEFDVNTMKELLPSYINLKFGVGLNDAIQVAKKVPEECYHLKKVSSVVLYSIKVSNCLISAVKKLI